MLNKVIYQISFLGMFLGTPLPAVGMDEVEKRELFDLMQGKLGELVPEAMCGQWSRNITRVLLHPQQKQALVIWVAAHPRDLPIAQFAANYIGVTKLHEESNPEGAANSLCLKAPRGSNV
jgi:hypothetical protein